MAVRHWIASVVSATALLASSGLRAGEVVWWTPNWGQARAEKLAADFSKANPGITIKLEVTTSNGLPQRVLTALQSGAAPDIIEVQHVWVNGYALNGLIQPLDDTIENKSDYNRGAIDYDTYEGKLWGIPYRLETIAMIANANLMQAAGLDIAKPPQTWPQWVDTAKKLTANGVYGFAITGGGEVGNTVNRLVPLIWMNGGDVISKDGKKAIVNTPEAIAAVKFYTDFFTNKMSPNSTLQNDGLANRQLFVAKKVAIYQSGVFDIAPITQADPSIKVGAFVMPHPEGKESTAILSGWSFVLPKDAKNPTDAKKLIKYLNTTDNQGYFTDTFPARISSMALPRFQDPVMKPFGDALANARPAPTNQHWVQISQALFDSVQRILSRSQTPKEALDQANDEIQALLDT